MNKIDFTKLQITHVEYWCPEEFIEIYEAEIIKGVHKKYKPKNPTGFACAHFFYFCVLKNGTYDMVSGLDMEAFLMKETYESRLKGVNERPAMTDFAAKAIVQYIKDKNAVAV